MKTPSDKDIAEALDAMRPETPDPVFARRVLAAAELIRQESPASISAGAAGKPPLFWALAGLGTGFAAALIILAAFGIFNGGSISWPSGMGYSYLPIEDILRPLLSYAGGFLA